jgi:hypothetical protein
MGLRSPALKEPTSEPWVTFLSGLGTCLGSPLPQGKAPCLPGADPILEASGILFSCRMYQNLRVKDGVTEVQEIPEIFFGKKTSSCRDTERT